MFKFRHKPKKKGYKLKSNTKYGIRIILAGVCSMYRPGV